MSWYLFWLLLHLLGAFGFVAAHGATAAVSLKLRREREPDRVRALLDLSKSTRSFMYLSLVLLLTAGIANGFVVHAWSQGWIWTALALLLFLLVAAFPLAVPYYVAIRRAVSEEPVDQERLNVLLASSRPALIGWIETVGIVIIVWLMVYKPF